MKDRVRNDIGTKGQLQSWTDIDWKLALKRVRNLRQRIYRAAQKNQWNMVRSLMKLMLRSYSNLLLSVRRVTQENQGKQTAGIDGQTALTNDERVKLVTQMKEHSLWKVRPTKRVYIPKANGKRRPLGIPTIIDRVAQAVVKNALEPRFEPRFEAHSYGFRPGRGTHDAIAQCFCRMGGGSDTWILDADIKGAFDNISHEYILSTIGNTPSREIIKQWLKAGYVEAEMFHKTESGTPQGGIISPLLANIALNGIEALLSQFYKVNTYTLKSGKQAGNKKKKKDATYGFIRYADDFIITAKSREDIEAIIPTLQEWLKERGLELNQEKTNISHVEEGFNFLGFNICQFKGKCLIKPQKEKVKIFLKNIRKWLKEHKQASPEAVIEYLNPVLRGWGNYYRHGVSKQVFSYVDHQIWKLLWKWSLRRHPNKSKKWVARKYFKTLQGRKWVFSATVNDLRGNKEIAIFRLSSIPIERHVKVKGTASPDDPELTKYWQDRMTRYGKTYWEKGTKLYKVATNQNWSCPICGDHLLNGEKLHTHHIVQRKNGGTDNEENLIHLHQACHRHVHSKGDTERLKA
ncbi:group II intron reverse transcriptase/maturase [Microcoleus asticus]|uniref:Group II intron-encoded protein LtrA n=1 Tax=Microcoleus asticus IPMA8 TaxID=2563858 RepID=A0ABX2DAD8_9CYAN|nr:Group II intron-encoded protein LtrA [Microcoleus asticus IPMA8]